jgi:hypothetical protein
MKPSFLKILSITSISIYIFLFWHGMTNTHAQDAEELTLSLRRNFGYSGGGDIQGIFTLVAASPHDLSRVVFLIDDVPLGESTAEPFQIQFDTGNYALGNHTLVAIGYTQDGRELHTSPIRVEFVSADEGWRAALRIAVPVLAIALGAALISFLGPMIIGRGKTKDLPLGAPRNYGFLGGTICPKCSRPFAMHIFGPNLAIGKLDRCPYCGRWSLVRRAFPNDLAAAEQAERDRLLESDQQPLVSEAERLRKDLEDSRYHDL